MSYAARLRLAFLSGIVFFALALVWGGGLAVGLIPQPPDSDLAELVTNPPAYADAMVAGSAARFEAQGDADLFGFMKTHPPDPDGKRMVAERAIRAILGEEDPNARPAWPYASHFGLQYSILRQMILAGAPAGAAVAGLIALCVLGSAVCVGIAAGWAARQAGARAGWATAGLLSLSPMFLERAASIYWVNAAAFAPMAASMLLAAGVWRETPGRARRRAGLLALLAALVCVKSLMGYEFLTSITLAAAAPVAFERLLREDGWTGRALRDVALATAAIIAACIAGFAAAVALHVMKASAIFGGDLGMGLQTVLAPLSYSISTGDEAMRNVSVTTPGQIAVSLAKAFAARNLPVNLLLWGGLAWGAVALARARGAGGAMAALTPRGRALARLLPVALLGMISWHLAASVHALVHSHVAWFTVQLNLIPVAAPLLVALHEARGKIA